MRGLRHPATERLANRVILSAARLLGVAAGTHLGTFRGRDGGYEDLKAQLDRAELLASIAWRVVGILQARLRKLPDRHRPHYSPAARFEILEIRSLLGWNQSRTAEQFLVSDNTIGNWEHDQSPESRTVGSLARPIPPVTRLSDVTRHLIHMMARFGFGGAEMIASHLALAGFRIAEKTVRNIKRERVVDPAVASPPLGPRRPNPVRADFVNHVWMMDVTEFKTLFGANTLYFAAVFDAFSRLPLAGVTFEAKPGGASMARLLKHAAARFGRPRYLITDLGGEFIAGVFKKTVAQLGVRLRYASADNIHATARLERFWKTLKEISRVRQIPPLTLHDLENRVSLALAYYAFHRPHTALGNRTPAMAFLGASGPETSRLPRGRRGEPAEVAPFQVAFLTPDRGGFPVLAAQAA
ncbi:MAG: DDE-type integrase/transposase/recombinase [Vicinamibacteria bacterium]|nr:DDE-type integrase/transposase/recombinase [Vicinamibacteria bacterium]